MSNQIAIDFFETDTGAKPVYEWLRSLPKGDRKIIGDDIRRIEEEWPLTMPVCRNVPKIKGVWELRTRTERLKSVRIFFTIEDGYAVLLHSFIKKQQVTPYPMIDIAAQRLSQYRIRAAKRRREEARLRPSRKRRT